MSKPYTEADFAAQIASDRTWRLKEISDLKNASSKADDSMRRVLLRSLVTICYAHWEGYVRFAARKYLEHVALRKLQYKELDRQFFRNYFMPRFAALSINKSSLTERCSLVDEVLNASERRFTKANDELVNTKANLNFDVFADICLVCGVSTGGFAASSTFIDILLLKRRNAIAHGEDNFIEAADMSQLTNETVGLMRAFGDELENSVSLKRYMAVA